MAHFIARTAVDCSAVLAAVSGRLIASDKLSVLFARVASIEVFQEDEPGVLGSIVKQPIFDNIVTASVLPVWKTDSDRLEHSSEKVSTILASTNDIR
jgi:hypothetical protein